MKKLLCVLLLLSNSPQAIYSYPKIQSNHDLARLMAEYQQDNLPDISDADEILSDYDVNVCDVVELQKVSWLEAKARAFGVAILFRLLVARDFIKDKFSKLKDSFAQLLGTNSNHETQA